MKKLYFAVILFVFATAAFAQKKPAEIPVVAKVDERIETTSIIARLAGFEEYTNNEFRVYADDVDRHFARYRDHAAVKFAVDVRFRLGIGFDAVPNLAVRLRPAPSFAPRVPFTSHVPDKRWGKEDAEKMARLIGEFYRDAKCAEFFKKHEAMYRTAETRMQKIVDRVDFSWYSKFYGELPKGSFNMIIGLLNGGGNFGPKVVLPNGTEELFSVMGTWQTEPDGTPKYSEDSLPTIIHEFNHSFINHLVAERAAALKAPGEKIFPIVKDPMQRLAYGEWQVIVMESLVRAAVIRYLFDHEVNIPGFGGIPPKEVPYRLTDFERSRGFYWIEDLVVLMGTFENARKSYPTFRAFMPIIEAYFQELPKRIDYRVRELDARRPTVKAIREFENGAKSVSAALTEITIVFDRRMTGRGYSMNHGSLGQEGYPEIEKIIGYGDENTTFKMAVKLKPGKDYEFVVTGNSFASADGFPLKDFVVRFSTSK